jgi:polar amino acid transport system substrate-binding protein
MKQRRRYTCLARQVTVWVGATIGFFGIGLAAAQNCAQLKVTAHPDYPPFAWTSAGKIDGALIRVIDKFAQTAGLGVTMVPAESWSQAQQLTATGQADLIIGLYRSPQRDQDLVFVNRPLAADPVGVFVRRADAGLIDTLADLKSRKGVAAAGESFGPEIDERLKQELSVSRSATFAEAVALLSEGRADYVLSGLYPGLAHLRQLGNGHGLSLTQASLIPSQSLYVAFSRNSPCLGLAASLDAAIEKMTGRGDMDGLVAEALIRWTTAQQGK